MTYSNAFVCLLGMGTVFCGLFFIILMCKIMGVLLVSKKDKKENTPNQGGKSLAEKPAAGLKAEIPNRRETVAAISAVIAEEAGTDVSAIRILSIEKI